MKIFSKYCIITIFLICTTTVLTIANTTLSPSSIFVANQDISYKNIAINSQVDAVDELVRRKEEDLALETLCENSIVLNQFVKKQILYARKYVLLLDYCLSSDQYYHQLSFCLDGLMKISDFFKTDLQSLIAILGGKMDKHLLYESFKSFLTYADELSQQGIKISSHGDLPASHEITKDNFSKYLNEMLGSLKENRHNIHSRTDAVLKISKGDIVSINDNYLLTEILKTFDYFLYSQRYSVDFFDELLILARKANLSFQEIVTAYKKQQRNHLGTFFSYIKENHRLTYSELLEHLLYNEKKGFYTKKRQGSIAGGDIGFNQEFSTIPENYRLFGAGIAIDCYYKWQSMGKPSEFSVIEMGAGEAGLAFNFLQTVIDRKTRDKDWQLFYQSLKYEIVDVNINRISKGRMDFLKDHVRFIKGDAASIDSLFEENSVKGVFLSNELADTFPVHKVRMVKGSIKEVFITEKNGFLIEEEDEVSTQKIIEYISENKIELNEGQDRVINLKSYTWIENMNKVLKEGFILIFDYGMLNDDEVLKIFFFSPLFRLYGAAREKILAEYFGVPEEMGISILGIEPYESFLKKITEDDEITDQSALANDNPMDRMLSLISNSKVDRLVQEAFQNREYVMKEYFGNPLVLPYKVDITTDVNFTDLTRKGAHLQLKQIFLGLQGEYFNSIRLHDHEWYDNVPSDSHFLHDLGGYYVQIFHKSSALDKNINSEIQMISIAA